MSNEVPEKSQLYDWQIPHTAKLMRSLRMFGAAKDGSDTGVGKTVIAVHVAKTLGLVPFVVCPKSVIPSWREWVLKLFPKVKSDIVHNYEMLRTGRTKYLKRRGKNFEWQLNRDLCLLIFDEDHRCKNPKSLNAKMLMASKRQGYKVLMLGATSCSSPLDMKALGYVLGLHIGKDYYKWCLDNCCTKKMWGGLEYKPSTDHLGHLHDMIYSQKGSRIRIKDLPEGTFPDNLIMADPYCMDCPNDTSDIDYHYAEIATLMEKELSELAEKVEEDEEYAMTEILRARQEIELLKVPIFVELIDTEVQAGNSVVVFMNFKLTQSAIMERLEDLGPRDMRGFGPFTEETVSTISGDQTSDEREKSVADFQANRSKVMLAMIQAGGVGLDLHDVHGGHPRISLMSPSYSAIDLKQALGRVHRSGGKSPAIQKLIFIKGTVEESVCEAVRAKLNNIAMINDKDVTPCGI